MGRRYFGTDGIRGETNKWPMTAEVAMALGMAAGTVFRQGDHRHTVIIGKDTRRSNSGCWSFDTIIAGRFGCDDLRVT
jgi:phosphoglucosamine mutase